MEWMLRDHMMQLTRWLVPRQIGQWRGTVSPPRCVASIGVLALILLCAGLTACESRSFERTTDGTTVYLDELSDAAKAEARQKIVKNLRLTAEVYDLSVGDEIEIFFQINRKQRPGEYVISIADKLRIEFLNDTDNTRTVPVRPDGRISLPLIGSVIAAGQTADALTHRLQERYSGVLTAPQITVNVAETHSRLEDFIEMIGLPSKGRSILIKVLPDGTIALPLLRPLKALGRTLKEIQDQIDAAYSALRLDVSVSVVPRALPPGTTFVFGEVPKPGRFDLERPRTVLMAVAQAGGVLPTGAMDSVRLFYIGDDGVQRLRSINLSEVMDDLKFQEDMVVPNNSIIYVPPTALAKTGRLLDAVLRDILRYNGLSIGGGFQIPPQSGSGITTFTTTTK